MIKLSVKSHEHRGQVNAAQWDSIRSDWPVVNSFTENSAVRKLFLCPAVLKSIYEVVEKSLKQAVLHEVGGFLVGYYNQCSAGFFEVAVLDFIEAKSPEESSPTLLNFGDPALLELDDLLEQNTALATVGWIHTHPGHGIYLSATDLGTIRSHFSASYQVSIVIESTTPLFLSGFFARSTNDQLPSILPEELHVNWKTIN